jgi:hypothetical protein
MAGPRCARAHRRSERRVEGVLVQRNPGLGDLAAVEAVELDAGPGWNGVYGFSAISMAMPPTVFG